MSRHSASAAHHVLFEKVSSRRIRWGTGPPHGATVELEQQPLTLTLLIVVASAAFALSTSAIYSWRKERSELEQRMALEANIGNVRMIRGGKCISLVRGCTVVLTTPSRRRWCLMDNSLDSSRRHRLSVLLEIPHHSFSACQIHS